MSATNTVQLYSIFGMVVYEVDRPKSLYRGATFSSCCSKLRSYAS